MRAAGGLCRMLRMTNDTPDTTPDTVSGGRAEGPEPGFDGWTTTETAAAALKRDPRTVKRLIANGELVGRQVKRGRAKPYEVDVASLKRLRDRWVAEGKLQLSEAVGDVPVGGYAESGGGEAIARAYTDISMQLARRSQELGEAKAQLMLTQRAESTVREELAEERRRREEAERESDRLRTQLEAERGKGFWRRLFG